jgi:hypothetical protein
VMFSWLELELGCVINLAPFHGETQIRRKTLSRELTELLACRVFPLMPFARVWAANSATCSLVMSESTRLHSGA